MSGTQTRGGRLFWRTLLLMVALGGSIGASEAQNGAAPPAIQIEYFGSETGYVVGRQEVTLLCVVRNVGATPLAADTLRLRCYAVSGLDYTTGGLTPTLPALSPKQALAYRWRLTPSAANGAMIAAALLESAPAQPQRSGGPQSPLPAKTSLEAPQAALAVLPRLASAPRLGQIAVRPGSPPDAGGNGNDAWIGNDLVGVRVLQTEGRQPTFVLAGRNGTTWTQVAFGASLAEVRSAEEGQLPWRESFRWRETVAEKTMDGATLTLRGEFGTRWGAEWTLEAQRDTAALIGRLRLTARRTMRLYGVHPPRLLAATEPTDAPPARANGVPYPLPNAEEKIPAESRVAAARFQGVAFGIGWSSASPLTNGQASRLAMGDTLFLPVLGVQWDASERGAVVLAGATLEFPFKLFAMGQSETILDALRFQLP